MSDQMSFLLLCHVIMFVFYSIPCAFITLLFYCISVYVVRCNLQSAADMDHRPCSETQKICLRQSKEEKQNTAPIDLQR